MDILLIDPPFSSLRGIPVDCGYNVGLTSLAAYIRREGIESAVLMGDLLMGLPVIDTWSADQEIGQGTPGPKELAEAWRNYVTIVNDRTHFVWGKLTDIVRQTNPTAVGISYLTPLKNVVERIAGLIKEMDRDIKIIVGSCHPTFCPEEVMQNPDIDFVVRGEGEIPLLRLVKEFKKDSPKWEAVPGIYYRDGGGQVRNNPSVNLINNLDELPFPARDLVLNCDYDLYRVHSTSTARGCPYTCAFCADRRFWGGKVRRRSVDNVIKELRLLKDTYKIKSVDFADGTFTFDRKYLETFCNTMIEHKLDIKWRCTARYDNLNEDLLQLMKQANCSGLLFGLESGSDRILRAMNKKTTTKQIVTVSKMVYDIGIPSVTSVMLGLPDENEEDMQETLRIMKEINTDIFVANNYTPLPGTSLYDSMSKEDKKNIDWQKVGYQSSDNYFSKSISQDNFEKYLSEAHEIEDNVLKKTLVRFRSQAESKRCRTGSLKATSPQPV